MKRSIWKTHENCEGSISLTRRIRNSKKPLRMLERNWKHQWLPLCFARQARRVSMERLEARLMISNQNLRVSWKPVNPPECVWKNLYQIIMRTMLQERRTIHCSITIWFTNLFLCLKIPAAKAAEDNEWEKLEKISAWNQTKVRSKEEVIDEARTKGAKVHFASLMDTCHLKNAELEAKHQKYRGRVVLRGDIVKDDSGSYAVLTEQGSSASQMTAAKVMDIISRLPGCAGQAADAKNGRCSKIIENSQFGMSRHVDSSTTTQMAKIMVQYGRPSRSSWAQSVRSSFGRTIVGKAIWENPIETWLGENSKLGTHIRTQWKRIILIRVCGWHQIGWKEKQYWSELLNKEVDLEEPTSFLDHVYLGCTQTQCEISKDIVDNYRTMFESRISAGGVEKLPSSQNLRISSWSHDMAGHAKKCVERYCELANKTTQQLYKVLLHASMPTTLKRKNWNL